ncbi:MAG: hypothetical protein ABR976_14870 [Terracidiphilus sp.]|jgi:hypothetical protein
MENRMLRTIPVLALLVVAAATINAQQPSPYQGTSNPPPDSTIETSTTPPPKPAAGKPLVSPAQAPTPADTQSQPQPQPSSPGPAAYAPPVAGTDGDVIQNTAPAQPALVQPALAQRAYASDPDGDIVHPMPLGPGQLGEGTLIRVKLLDRLSTVDSEKGEPFRSQVASDVFQGNNVVIPAGSEIDGRVVEVSSGHFGGHGSMRLRPESVILPDGTRCQLRAQVTATPGSHTRVGSEGAINPGSRLRRDGIEYGGVVTAGVITGAFIGGPVGAVAGGAVGAGVVTTHLLVNHPQAILEPGAVIDFTLTDTLSLTPAVAPGS